ncbi:hypothetical protein FJTKL_03181 [Diaporthe vaccinii]|uniref:Uncharacterized protein n=1 Tax=Diaporthe vaccinii TaxID=105482 RepID=A0ABR4DVX2_9PEZI
MPAYISHLLDEGISEHESRSLGVETLFTDTALSTISPFTGRVSPAESKDDGGISSPETIQPSGRAASAVTSSRAPDSSQGTQRTHTAPKESRSASEGPQTHLAVFNLHLGPRSYRLRPPVAERPHSIFAPLPEIEGPHAYLLMLPATELPLRYVYLIPVTEAHRSRVVLQPVIERPLSSNVKVRLERQDIHTGETQRVETVVERYNIDTGETPGVGTIRLGLRYT